MEMDYPNAGSSVLHEAWWSILPNHLVQNSHIDTIFSSTTVCNFIFVTWSLPARKSVVKLFFQSYQVKVETSAISAK